MKKHTDTDIRAALKRKEQKRQPVEVPDDFLDNVLGEIEQDEKPKTVKLWRYLAIAAGIALLIGIGALMIISTDNAAQPYTLAVTETATYTATRQPLPTIETTVATEPTVATKPTATTETHAVAEATVEKPRQKVAPKKQKTPDIDLTPSVSPAKMDELIASLAKMQGAEKKVFDCETDEAVYVFEDNDDLNLFGRLILAASNYPNDTEGYFLNYSAEKFFFCIDDETNGDGYLWTAEKVGDSKIMLYCSHSPAGIADESDCFKNFARKITFGNMNTLTQL